MGAEVAQPIGPRRQALSQYAARGSFASGVKRTKEAKEAAGFFGFCLAPWGGGAAAVGVVWKKREAAAEKGGCYSSAIKREAKNEVITEGNWNLAPVEAVACN